MAGGPGEELPARIFWREISDQASRVGDRQRIFSQVNSVSALRQSDIEAIIDQNTLVRGTSGERSTSQPGAVTSGEIFFSQLNPIDSRRGHRRNTMQERIQQRSEE